MPQLNRLPACFARFAAAVILLGGLWGCAAPGSTTPTALNSSALPPPKVSVSSATPSPQPPAPTLTPTPLPPSATPLPPVRMEVVSVYSNYLGNTRPVTVYLPGEYASQPDKRYRVLYANDGQDLREIAFDLALNSLFATRQVEPIIVVAVPSNANRIYEYGTGTVESVDGWGTLAQAYNNYILRELKPFIDSKYRTLTGPQNTAFMGWSLGGLAAFYLAWQYSAEIGIVGAFSPSLWWRTSQNNLQDVLNSRVIHSLVRQSSKRPGLRMWFEAGTADETNDRDKNGVIDAIQDITDLMDELAKKGYQMETDMRLVVVAGGRHEIATWATVIPDFLRWAFPAK